MAGKNEETEKSGGGGLRLVVPALLAGAVALGVSYLDPLGGDGAQAAEEGAAPKKESAAGVSVLDPMIVSLSQEAPGRQGPRLRVGIALRAAAAPDETQALLLRDGFTAAAHGIAPDTLAGPDGLATLRAALLDAARGVLGEEAVEAVLITDYVLI